MTNYDNEYEDTISGGMDACDDYFTDSFGEAEDVLLVDSEEDTIDEVEQEEIVEEANEEVEFDQDAEEETDPDVEEPQGE